MEQEKKVEYIELFYDLIFVFCVSRLTALLRPMAEAFEDFTFLPVYAVLFLVLLQIWVYTTFLINRYGYRHATDYLCIFINMFFLFYMADGVRGDWTSESFIRFLIAWVIILLNLAVQFGYKLHKHECMDGLDDKIIRSYMKILITESLLAALLIPLYLATGSWIGTVVPLAVSFVMTWASASLFRKRPVHYGHLTERLALFVVITFGEMVVGISGYFTTEVSWYYAVSVFLIVFGLFLIFLFDFYNYQDQNVRTAGIRHTVMYLPLILGANNITVALEAMPESAAGTLPKTVYLVVSMSVYMAAFLGLARHHKPEFRGEVKKAWLRWLIFAVYAAFSALLILLHAKPEITAALTVVMIYLILLLMWRFYKANTKEQRIAAFCELRPPYEG